MLHSSMLPVVVLLLLQSVTLRTEKAASAAAAQIPLETTTDRVSPANALTGPDFRMLMQIMRTDIVRCGVPLTAVLHWHVLPSGVIDDFVLTSSSGNSCFDEIVVLNAEQVLKAQLRMTPATRNGVAESAWVPFSVAARD